MSFLYANRFQASQQPWCWTAVESIATSGPKVGEGTHSWFVISLLLRFLILIDRRRKRLGGAL